MFVRSLSLAGFKSFPDPTVLEFDEGVNVIVGPNGSGKSNIADAIQWVLGSQAPSSLRGGSMEDVIFAGSEERPRLGVATVELTLDNSSGTMPVDVGEVTITRSSDRSGASEYRINGVGCRLLDVQELLSDTGIGRSLHSLVGQGRLDAVLQARPEDRRVLVEEAAQIGKYRRRKERTLRKLDRVDENLVRVEDVLREVRRAVRPLRRQASAAKAHSELIGEQRRLRQALAATEIARLVSEQTELDASDEEHRAALLADELAHVRALLGGASEASDAGRASAELAQQTAQRMSRAGERLASLSRIARERTERIDARLSAETEENYSGRIRRLEADRERFTALAAQLSDEAAGVRERVEAARAVADELRRGVDAAEAELADARGAETEAVEALVRAEGSEAARRATLTSIQSRAQAILERRAATAHELEEDEAAVAAAQQEAAALERGLDATTEEAAAAEASLEQAQERAGLLRDGLGASVAARAAARARVEALGEAAAVLHGVRGALELLQPLREDAERGNVLAAADEDAARRLLSEAEQSVELRWQEVARKDDDLRRMDALLAGAGERLAGARRRRETRAVELATLDDELARVQEAIAAAEAELGDVRARLPARHAVADEARVARGQAEKRVAAARAMAERGQNDVGELTVEGRAAEERVLAAQLRVEEADAGIADAERGLAGVAELRASLQAARERAARVASVAVEAARRGRSWVEDADRRAERARASARAAEDRLARLRRRERELEREREALSEARGRIEVRSAELRARTHALGERALEEWGLGIGDLLAVDILDGDEENEARARVEELERQIGRLGPVNPRAAEEYEAAAERERFLVEQTEDLKTSRRDLLKIVREVDATIVQVFEEAFASVAREFETVFARVFPGGDGRLRPTEPENLLTTGIEIDARPPGKSIKKLSLLSGGERSLVALVFLFSIFRALPSPFYLLDEVEAALDDVNLQRFLSLVTELEQHAQVLIVTHQKRTMEAADVLYGVTMGKEGVSRVVAQRMEEVSF